MQNVFRSIGLAMILIAAVMLLTGCSDGGGANSDELRRLAGTNMPQPAQAQQATPLPRPTETPDFGNAQPAIVAPTPAPQIVEVTREIVREATVVQTQQIEVTRIVRIEVMPQPTAYDCDRVRLTPAPTVPLDATDIAAGVVLIGGGWPQCVWSTEVAR